MRRLVLSFSVWAWAAALAGAERPGHVILVSIDGLAAYELEDDTLAIPNLRELIADGVWATSSETVFPSVTHPGHTSLVTGTTPRVHGVLGNRLVNRDTGERFHVTNKPHTEMVRVPTLFDAAKAKGLVTAAFYWPESLEDPALDFNLPEVFDGDTADPRAADPAFLDELRDAGVPIDLYYRWYKDRVRKGAADTILAEAAAHILKEYRPNLLAIHLLVVDEIQHAYGTEHYLSKAAITAADAAVGILRRAVAEAGLADATAFFVVSDHGFHTATHEVNLYPVFSRRGLLDRVKLHPSHWLLWIEAFDLEQDGPALESLFLEALALPGVASILRPADLHALGFPQYEEDPHVRGQFAIVGDIDTLPVADPSSATTLRRERTEPYHGHGYLPSHPRMYPVFLAAGPGIKRGRRLGHVRNIDLAPTIARLLGLELPSASGVVLSEVLQEDAARAR